jgi:hypothetical protein
VALDDGLALLVGIEEDDGLGVDQLADLSTSSGLIRAPDTSLTIRMPFATVCSSGAGRRAEVAQGDDGGRPASRPPEQELRISGRRPMPESPAPWPAR